ncbi:NAD-dependent deacylase [Chitinophaga ginsengisegetis]|uniref:SIR2 family NAD-dependent protein deacylase n=1 Tax=Chitinophaga ginsengisegetis TaxID=393003 RepID=UPI000DBACBA6|nr:NAD-dependent deacylase [Chitinophaga ginsengisegetis]MDR6567804.1 NAD-dependent deacetylase [Chitinophaga ginsengisegetis]MDR6647641.1 NAD-dependent deacetylase [Chitinophaga ginsengisegetis]MDR6653991.1 NAD-dependent deacetylase [Chitinophaga ginsengisegetis]
MKPRLVVLTGAGISAESGLRTFRDTDGLWEGYDVYEVASPQGWQKNPALVQDFYNGRRQDVKAALPNAAHTGLAKLEEKYDVRIITQNIDDLHERGGSTRVLHLHGEIFKMRSVDNEELIYDIHEDIKMGDLAEDGGQLRPHIVWFGEAVPMIEKAAREVWEADVFVVVGTSLQVYPAASLLQYVKPGVPVYIIDRKIPEVAVADNLHLIEKPATEGVLELLSIL